MIMINKMFKRVLLNEHVPKTCSSKHIPPNQKCGCPFGNTWAIKTIGELLV